MSAKQGNNRNKVKDLCLYSVLCAVCMVIGYIESTLDLSFIAPGIKIGLSNSVACVLIFRGDIKGAFAVNISRILLSALLFGSAVSLVFSLCGGIFSMIFMILLKKARRFSIIGISVAGGAVHNAAQCLAGNFFVGMGVIYYLPVLLLAGVLCGAITGFLSSLIIKRF